MKFFANRPAIIVALFMFSSVVFLGCQSYTTGLQKTRTNVDETAVIATLQTVATAQRAYSISNGGDYGSFEQLTAGDFLDSRFASETPEVRGYVLTMATGDKEFRCNADPANNADGKHFYMDSKSSLVRVNPTQPASASDPVYRP
jgi:hypothetical protein